MSNLKFSNTVEDVFKLGLMAQLKDRVIDSIVTEQLAKFEEELRDRLETETKDMVIEDIATVRDQLELIDRCIVKVKINGKEYTSDSR